MAIELLGMELCYPDSVEVPTCIPKHTLESRRRIVNPLGSRECPKHQLPCTDGRFDCCPNRAKVFEGHLLCGMA